MIFFPVAEVLEATGALRSSKPPMAAPSGASGAAVSHNENHGG
ncbi:MAG: hypothetical protein R6V49_11370 [Bacteroidales bacterium]